MSIDAKLVAELRNITGAGMMDAKSALEEAGGDLQLATDVLRKKGVVKAAKRAGRTTGEGVVYSYIHSTGKIGVLLELQCETDFVARTEDFKEIAHKLAMHIAAVNPSYLDDAGIPEADIARETEIASEVLRAEGKPADMIAKIVDGKLEKWKGELVLLRQPFVMDEEKTVEAVLQEAISKIGENIRLTRFARFDIQGGMTACSATVV